MSIYSRTDFSIHFILKDQLLSEIAKKLNSWLEANKNIINPANPETVLHHCFLPREVVIKSELNTEWVDYIDQITTRQVRWFAAAPEGIEMSRQCMLRNLQKCGGIALFIGTLTEGAEREYQIASDLGIDCIIIP